MKKSTLNTEDSLPENKSKESERHIDAVVNSLKILDLFEDGEPLRLKDILAKTALNKSRIIRICGTLSFMGYLIYDTSTMTYTLGTRIQSLGKAYEKNNPLYASSKPILKKLAEETKETCSIFVIDGNAVFCLARKEGPQALRYSIAEGTKNNKWQGASSKILLAHADNSFAEKIIKEMPDHYASGDAFSENLLLEQLEEIREKGYAYSAGELINDVSAYSCPIYNYDGKVCAAISVTGPMHRLTEDNKDFILEKLKNAAQKCSESLGYTDQVS